MKSRRRRKRRSSSFTPGRCPVAVLEIAFPGDVSAYVIALQLAIVPCTAGNYFVHSVQQQHLHFWALIDRVPLSDAHITHTYSTPHSVHAPFPLAVEPSMLKARGGTVACAYICPGLTTVVQCCRPQARFEVHYTSDTEYSDDQGSEDEEDDISVCSGSTISAGGQSCTASDLMGASFDEAFSSGEPRFAGHCTSCNDTYAHCTKQQSPI